LANQLVALSLEHYSRSNWQNSMEVCNQQLAPDPRNTAAYNNLCCSQIKLKDCDRTVQKTLEIGPHFELAGNNLRQARRKKAGD